MAANDPAAAGAPQPTGPCADVDSPCLIHHAVLACGLNGSEANAIADELFQNDFEPCKTVVKDDIVESVRILSKFSANRGRILILPLMAKKLQALLFWVQHQFRCIHDPAHIQFDPMNLAKIF